MEKFNYEIKRQILEGRYQMSYKSALKIKNLIDDERIWKSRGKKNGYHT